ncbi:hypothetical protein CISIN_1g041844mg, partial [Citrus sinensis]
FKVPQSYGENNSSDELLQAQLLNCANPCLDNTFSFINSMSLKCVKLIQVGIPDIIHNHTKPMTLNQLLGALQIHPTKTRCLHFLVCSLVRSGFFNLR